MTGRRRIAPGQWGEISINSDGDQFVARARVRRLDGSYTRIKVKGATKTAARRAAADHAATTAGASARS